MPLICFPFTAHPGGEEADLGGNKWHRGVSPGVQVLHGGHCWAEQLPAVSVSGSGVVYGVAHPETGDKRVFCGVFCVLVSARVGSAHRGLTLQRG